jgi:hypothetical protein
MKPSFCSLTGCGALCLGVLLAGCGGGPTASTPVATPTSSPTPAPVVTLLKEGSVNNLHVLGVFALVFNTTKTGAIAATVDWTLKSDYVWTGLVAGNNPCVTPDRFFHPSTCRFVRVASRHDTKPQVIDAVAQAPGTYTLYTVNVGPKVQALSYQVFLTSVGN